jgi:hypothetical protein
MASVEKAVTHPTHTKKMKAEKKGLRNDPSVRKTSSSPFNRINDVSDS